MFKRYASEGQSFNGKRTLFVIIAVIIATVVFTSMLPADPSSYGIFSVVPAVFLIIYIFATQRILEALILASLVGFIMVSRPETMGNGETWLANSFNNFSEGMLSVMMDEDIAWLIIVCGLMGSIIALIEKAGGSYAFGEWIATKAKTEKLSLIHI